MALRGGILDFYPLTSPWPVRLEFFGDELESFRHFDPLTQISREEIVSITVLPAGGLGLLKKSRVWSPESGVQGDRKSTRLNSSHQIISYAVFCLKKKKK